MNPRWRIFPRLAAVLGAGQILLFPLLAQEAPDAAGTSESEQSEPPVPLLRSPVDSFRELLAMTLEERKQALAARPPEMRKRILAKVREYLSLKPDERELRLRATELRWYVVPLLNTPATNRAAQLIFIPPELRKPITDRITQWDKLAPAAQKELLENELTERYFTQLEGSTREQRTNILAGISPERRAQLEAGMNRWGALSEKHRRKTCERFDQFFELTPREKEKALQTLSEAERQQMEKTLRAFEKLPKDQRERCVRSFEKFASLSLEERRLFLKNAERWRLMSPGERQAWRELVAQMPEWPPMPPFPPPPLPPSPPPPLPPDFPVPVATDPN
ncbi:MAG: DUF3106 domain-containing protein [Verrucomicrobia bacterium]|jgi:hypothetical protein|nr:DUF3106 domain-containing protein [Verrucomicrobiota bacterium]